MMRALVLCLALVSPAAVAAVELDCTLARRCMSPSGCEPLDASRADVRARLSFDEQSRVLTLRTSGTIYRLELLGEDGPGTTWAAVDGPRGLAMLVSLRPDLHFALSGHFLQDNVLVASAGQGTCVEVAP